VFGYPISGVQVETIEGTWTGPIQWFERDRLEDHSNEGRGVPAGRLGERVLLANGIRWQDGPSPRREDCRYFTETRQNLCQPFLAYWEQNGGLERFGYPLTTLVSTTLRDPVSGEYRLFPVQYFERRRMELHNELPGSPILLGLLGVNTLRYGGCDPAAGNLAAIAATLQPRIGCPSWPSPNQLGETVAIQPFERGTMLATSDFITRAFRTPPYVYALFVDNARGTLVWQRYEDTWNPSQPERGGETPPTGLFEPIRGFGKVWREQPQVRNTLGWGVAPEASTRGVNQAFTSGAVILERADAAGQAYVLYPDGRAEVLPLWRP
jgi:hypothetical protein